MGAVTDAIRVMQQAKEEIYKLRAVVSAVVEGFHPDPGTSDLDDEQPIHVCIPLGVYRKAQRLI